MLQFVREVPVRILMQKTSSERRGFLFYLSAGFSKEINPLSGMTVNLVEVDKWLSELRYEMQESIFESSLDEVMAFARDFLQERAATEKAELVSVEFREERSWSFAWSNEQAEDTMTIKYQHYLEAFALQPEDFGLLKIEFSWLRAAHSEIDFQHEGFKILKNLAPKNPSQLREQLQAHRGMFLSDGSSLASVTLHYLGEDFELTL